MKNLKKIIMVLLLLAMAGTGYGLYLYHKKPADTRNETARFELSAAALVADFNRNETMANQKYTDKVISVTGKVTDLKIDTAGQATVFLDSGDPMAAVTCSFYKEETPAAAALEPGDEIAIKGICTGKLTDIVLNKCSIKK